MTLVWSEKAIRKKVHAHGGDVRRRNCQYQLLMGYLRLKFYYFVNA